MLFIALIVLALVYMGVTKLARASKTQPFSAEALYASIGIAVALIVLSQKGWLVFALIPLAIVLSIFLYFFWKIHKSHSSRFSMILKLFIASTLIAYASVLGIGDGNEVLAWSVIATDSETLIAQSSMAVSIVAGISSAISFSWLFYTSLSHKR